jgi:hypothetical protein
MIGAGALAARGVARSTFDHDLLVTDPVVLDATFWSALDAQADVLQGDADDPLRGVVRLSSPGERDVDVIVGRHAWQRDIVTRAERLGPSSPPVPVVRAADLVLLKLYAGGAQDLWDIEQIMALDDDGRIEKAVDEEIGKLPEDARAAWTQWRGGRR